MMTTFRRISILLVVILAIALPSTTEAKKCKDGYYKLAGICVPNSRTLTDNPLEPPVHPGEPVEKFFEDPVKMIVNPMGYIDQSGIPSAGDFLEFVIKSPDKIIELVQNPAQWPYMPVANAMISGRNAVVTGGGQGIPPEIRAVLLTYAFRADLLDSARWTTDFSLFRNTIQAAQMERETTTGAITLLNAIVFRDDDVAHSTALWAHEMIHLQQYRRWGVFGFAKRWVQNSSVTGPVEDPAYKMEQHYREAGY